MYPQLLAAILRGVQDEVEPMYRESPFPILSAEEAAAQIHNGSLLACSGFTAAGSAKAVPRALAARAREIAAQYGEPLRIRLLSGASTGPHVDAPLGEANAIRWRAPYQAAKALRQRINQQECEFLDLHLSHVPQLIDCGFLGDIDVAVIEAVDVTRDGRVYLTTSSGISPTILRHADKVIIERNAHHSPRLAEMHDITILPRPPHRHAIPIDHPMAKIGVSYAAVDPKKIIGIVETDEPDGVAAFAAPNDVSRRIAEYVMHFLLDEQRAGRIPPEFLPLQAGVGNISNAVMENLGSCPDIPPFYMFTEVFQDSLVHALMADHLRGVSTAGLTLSQPEIERIYGDMDFFCPRIVIRPQELSNNPGLIRRLGVIAINVAMEFDIYGCANSTHVCGTQLMNGIGGSGDFMRNAYLSIFVSPSIAKGGKISCVVPMVSHVDHNEHSLQILVTEQGLADLRGLGPIQRARAIIDNCAHPAYRDYLHRYIDSAPVGHFRHDLRRCFELHNNLLEHGAMLPDLEITG